MYFVLGARDTGVNITEAQHLDAYISSGKDNFLKKVNKIIAGSDVLRRKQNRVVKKGLFEEMI